MLRVGLTGGIGSGKSEVAKLLADHGAVVVDADRIAREVVVPGSEGLAALVTEFGAEILLPDATLDRAALAALAFTSPERLARLNAVMHPRIAAVAEAEANAAAPDAVLVYDMPLLVENGLTADWDVVVVVDAPTDVRLARAVAGRGLAADDVRRRMAAQASQTDRLAVADLVIDNSGDLAQLRSAVDVLWQRLRAVQTPGPY